MSFTTIPFDEIASLEINLITGAKKEIPLSFTKTVDEVVEPIDLSLYANIKLNVFNTNGTTPVSALSKDMLVDNTDLYINAENELIIVFGEETSTFKNNSFYFYIEFVNAPGIPSDCYLQGIINVKEKISFLPRNIANKC
jgi:hypothetical protein